MFRRIRYARALKSREGLCLIRLTRWIKNNNDEGYEGDDRHSVTNENPAQEWADIEEMRARKQTPATRKSIGYLCRKKLTWLAIK